MDFSEKTPFPKDPFFRTRILIQGGSGTEPEPETGTVGIVFPGTEVGTGTVGTVFQEPKPEPEPCLSVRPVFALQRKTFPETNRRNRKPEPLEPSQSRTATEPNRTGTTLLVCKFSGLGEGEVGS